jgi:aspartate racemase
MSAPPRSVKPIPPNREVVGIVGGYGPYAHIGLETRLLALAREMVGAERDQDFPAWILSSFTETPDRVRYLLGCGPDALSGVVESFRQLQRLYDEHGTPVRGADFAVLTCITAHALLPKVRERVTIPIVDMVALTAEHIAACHPGARVGVLATTATLQFRLFRTALAEAGLAAVTPLDLPDGAAQQARLVMGAIYGTWSPEKPSAGGIKGCGVRPEYVRLLAEAARLLRTQGGADVVIAGCTEIDEALTMPVLEGMAVVSPYDIIARYIIRRLYRLTDGAA